MIKRITAASFAVCALCTGAQAATMDFVAEAAGNERGVVDGTVITFDGLDVEFNSSDFAYFDDLSGGKPGGLGVCKVLTASDQCTPSSDDNLTSGETVTLSFRGIDFYGLSFNDDDHNSLDTSTDTLLIGVNGGGPVEYTFAAATSAIFSGITSITFAHGGADPDNYYISAADFTPVPIPAGFILLGSALGGLGVMRRRKKKTA